MILPLQRSLLYFRCSAVQLIPLISSSININSTATSAIPKKGISMSQPSKKESPGSRANNPRQHEKKPFNKKNVSPSGGDGPIDKNFGFGERKPVDENGFKNFLQYIQAKRSRHCKSIKDYNFNTKRVRNVNDLEAKPTGNYRGVCFWMFRDQRIDDNWALIYAQKFALQHKCPLYVTFYLMSHYSVAGTRQYEFMLKGLQEVEKQCKDLGIQFHLELGYAKDQIADYCERHRIDLVICDLMPLRDPLSWVEQAGLKLRNKNVPLLQVDAHNIVPVWLASKEAERIASTIRPKIFAKFPEFLTEMPAIEKHPHQPELAAEPADWEKAWAQLKIDETVKPVSWAKPGTTNGYRMLYEFITQRLEGYEENRNIPTKCGASHLSPYFHFGQISAQRAVLEVGEKPNRDRANISVEQFIEEAVVRRELADNLCWYNPNYDNFKGAPEWAKQTINEHHKDKREYIYTLDDFQFAKTHDKAWNFAQNQMLQEGQMHGYMRMYWAKKIYEWSPSVKEALKIAILLNDKYNLDGRDPNGYTGIMWCICGVHDRPFTERPVVGKIRYMSYFGCAKKFDVNHLSRLYNTR